MPKKHGQSTPTAQEELPEEEESEQGKDQDRTKVVLPRLGLLGMLRWAWAQLTSMRTALFLLLLIAVAAVPGSLFPQRIQGAAAVTQYISARPGVGEVMDWFGLFDVYTSPWFSAIYLLLFVSLVGCVIPRARQHWKAMRAKLPRTPRRLSRLPEYGTLQIPAGGQWNAESAVERAAQVLRKRGYRVAVHQGERPSVGAERGFLKEIGNLMFHISLIGVLVAVALSGMFGYSGQRIIVTGNTFVNTLVGYDTFNPGTNFNADWLQPYSLRLDKFTVQFDRSLTTGRVQPLDFNAELTVRDSADAAPEGKTLRVNEPLAMGNTDIFLLGNGYAPHFTVRDAEGNIAFSDWVVGKLASADYTSSLTIKVPDAAPEQLGFSGLLLPTAIKDPQGVDINRDPDPANPLVLLNSYVGDLGLNDGQPQNVFVLDTANMRTLNDRSLPTGGISLSLGQTYDLPEGKGSITFDNLTRYIGVEVRANGGQAWILGFVMVAFVGLLGSLFLARRRAWVRTGTHPDGRVMVEYGLLARGEDYRLASESKALRADLIKAWDIPDTQEGGVAETDREQDNVNGKDRDDQEPGQRRSDDTAEG
ncbi:cytochrome c biogenesis protein ResB [Acaricomes phytoseiuli]|uniref:cytochrome c biogenesis protein ResB n=1 Tax=Acaricomes phytoseiuli TaxID=291968 RepID=UPI00037D1B5C|nr:cytochrome c biogenesis protein ResB [Acaricomes phytoseiuli]MCW1250055.1 cytochrome c biogenesis protein ResB [Acaricomes phytoseiuli]